MSGATGTGTVGGTLQPRTALLSVTDKAGVVELGRALAARGVRLVASGGTAAALQAAGLAVTAVEELTHSPEMLGGRVKTLHPALHAGILADRGDPSHTADLAAHGLQGIDLVVVNFYDFAAAAAREPLPIEAIDIGGPALARAGAKNHAWVTVLSDPSEYRPYLARIAEGGVDLEFRRGAAARTFARVAAYDQAIEGAFDRAVNPTAWPAVWAPRRVRLPLDLRYGENPHQPAAVYRDEPAWGFGRFTQAAGPELSFNNVLDGGAAWALAHDLGEGPACVLVKHNNPCGVGRGTSAAAAFAAALQCDPVSAFGGIAAFNVPVDEAAAAAIGDLFLEVLCAPQVDAAARQRLAGKKRLRILEIPADDSRHADERRVHGLLLVQDADRGFDELTGATVPTRRAPNAAERAALEFVWRVCKHVKSNAIVLGTAARTLGIGAGQMSRVDSCELAIRKARAAGFELRGAAAASDAFFPFADGLQALVEAGVTAVVQPGGSKRDAEVVAAADEAGVAMLFTGRRHFRH